MIGTSILDIKGNWFKELFAVKSLAKIVNDRYYVAYKPITLLCILFTFIKMISIHYHSCVIFVMKSMNICNE